MDKNFVAVFNLSGNSVVLFRISHDLVITKIFC